MKIVPIMLLTIGLVLTGCKKSKPPVVEGHETERIVTRIDGTKQVVEDPDYTRSFRIEAYSIDNNNTWTKMGSWEKVTLPYNNTTGFWIFSDFNTKNEIQIPSDWHLTITETTGQ